MTRHLIFSVDHVPCALPLGVVRIVLRMVQVIPPKTGVHGFAGTVNLHGEILPVCSVRTLFGLDSRPALLTDKLVVAEAGGKSVALWVDEARVPQQNPDQSQPAGIPDRGEEVTPGISLTDGGMFIIADLARFLMPENAPALREAFARARALPGGVDA